MFSWAVAAGAGLSAGRPIATIGLNVGNQSVFSVLHSHSISLLCLCLTNQCNPTTNRVPLFWRPVKARG
ncbi:hypothetical protein Q31b_53720 [Novipirellula aureliae]|uniref:Uncharacterized protein n=1 Tax=Novipirellula aureliae TaxID=2527966 RepID=A0A5C6DK21_9BACT|nr:hypothetical protein Q31b_53720 [Novipirellula aureliae]